MTIFQVEEDLHFLQMENDLIFLQIEDDLIGFKNGRQTQLSIWKRKFDINVFKLVAKLIFILGKDGIACPSSN